jgi:hypothetical protein
MKWPFDHHKTKRDERVTSLDAQARTGEVKLVEKVLELDRRRHYLDRLAEETLNDLGGSHRV